MPAPPDDRFRALADAAFEAMVVHADGVILDFNRAAEELFRVSTEDARGRRLLDFVAPEERAQVLGRASSGAEESYDSIGLCADGTKFPVEARGRAIVWDGRPARVAVMRDLTQRKAAEAALRASEELNRRIIETMPGGCVQVGPDGAVVAANEEARRFLGLAWDSLSRRLVSDWEPETLREDGTPCPVDEYPIVRSLRTGAMHGPVTIGVRRPDGGVSWGVFRATPVLDPLTGAAQGAVTTFLDITERKLEEEVLRESQRLESLGLMAGGIAHDFNNILVAILGHQTLALARLGGKSEARDNIEKAAAATRRAADLTRQILAYTGRAHFTVGPLDLNAFVLESLGLVEIAVPKNVRLQTRLAPGLAAVAADRAQLQQVVVNLVLNAAEAIGERGGSVVIATSARRVGEGEPGLWPHSGFSPAAGDFVELRITDDGCGMSPATRARIFEPFFTTKLLGRGLGLAAVLGILRAHGGGLHVDSEPGRGTTFAVLLPVAGHPALPGYPAAPAPLPAARPRGSVLVIDDEPSVREVVCLLLRDAGIHAESASGGREGVDLFRATPGRFALVILDLSMPGLSGAETFEELRRADPGVRVLLASGFDREEATRRFEGKGLAGFLAKPFDERDLVEAVTKDLSITGA